MAKRKVRITNTGYLPDSPDRHNSMNIIPSNQITMDTVPFPIMGIDNLGNQQMMMPGMDYTFPGQYVTEIPLGKYQKGKQVPTFILNRSLANLPRPVQYGIIKNYVKKEKPLERLEPLPIQKLPTVSQPGLVPYILPKQSTVKSTPIYQASQAHRIGQYQIGNNVWNEDKKTWERELFKDSEERDWHYNNGLIKREEGGLVKYQKKGEVEPITYINLEEYKKAKEQQAKELELYNAQLEAYELSNKAKEYYDANLSKFQNKEGTSEEWENFIKNPIFAVPNEYKGLKPSYSIDAQYLINDKGLNKLSVPQYDKPLELNQRPIEYKPKGIRIEDDYRGRSEFLKEMVEEDPKSWNEFFKENGVSSAAEYLANEFPEYNRWDTMPYEKKIKFYQSRDKYPWGDPFDKDVLGDSLYEETKKNSSPYYELTPEIAEKIGVEYAPDFRYFIYNDDNTPWSGKPRFFNETYWIDFMPEKPEPDVNIKSKDLSQPFKEKTLNLKPMEIPVRETKPVYQQSYAHKKGQYQIGEDIKNPKTGKWERKLFKDDEANWHRNQGLIKRKEGGIYLGKYEFKDGGLVQMNNELSEFKDGGKIVSEIWVERTGLPWKQAKAMGLSDGSFERNIELRKELLSGKYDNLTNNKPKAPVAVKKVVKQAPEKKISRSSNESNEYGLNAQPAKPLPNYIAFQQPTPQQKSSFPTFAEFQKQKLNNALTQSEPKSKSSALPTENKRMGVNTKDQAFYDLLDTTKVEYNADAESTARVFNNIPSLDTMRTSKNAQDLLLRDQVLESQKSTLSPGNFSSSEDSGFDLPSPSDFLRKVFLPKPLQNISIDSQDISDFKESATKKLEEYGILEPSTEGNLIKFEQPKINQQPVTTTKKPNYYIPPTQLQEDNNADYGEADNKFWGFRYQNSNDSGLVYVPTPRREKLDKNSKFSGVKGVAHFLIQTDATDGFIHPETKKHLEKDLREGKKYVPFIKKEADGKVRLKYAKGHDEQETFSKEGYEPFTTLRTLNLSDVDWNKSARPKGFKSGISNILTKDGKDTWLVYKEATGKDKKLGQFNGGALVFIVETPNGRIIRDFTGTIQEIENESKRITKEFNIPAKNVTLGFYDAGSYTAKPKANKNNELYFNQYSGFNTIDRMSGAALMVPTDQENQQPQFKNGGTSQQGMYLGKYEFKDGGLVRMQEGGSNFKTKLSAEEEQQFKKFYDTLPGNLKSDDSSYDIRGYWDASGRPEEFDYEQPTDEDGYYHAFSRHPETGKILKSPGHPTFNYAIEKGGFAPYEGEYVPMLGIDGNVYSRDISQDIPDVKQNGGLIQYQNKGQVDQKELERRAKAMGWNSVEEYKNANWKKNTNPSTNTSDTFDLALDAASFVPGYIGMGASAIGLGKNLYEGDLSGAALDGLNIVTGGAAKWLRAAQKTAKFANAANAANKVARQAKLLEAASNPLVPKTIGAVRDVSNYQWGEAFEPFGANATTIPSTPKKLPKKYTPTEDYIKALKIEENGIGEGFNKDSKKWLPYASKEGGNKTIAYGHKLTNEEVRKGTYSKGITEQQAEELFNKDLANHVITAERVYNNRHGKNAFDKVPDSLKDLIVDYTYNGVIDEFTKFTSAIDQYSNAKTSKEREVARQKMLKEYKRTSEGQNMVSRNAFTKKILDSIPVKQDGGSKEMPLDLPLKEQNIYLLPEYNQPINPFTGEILPDMRRPNLGMDTGATEYKYTYGSDEGDIDVPSIVSGQYIGDKALDRYNLTGERFKTMNDPSSYSKFYDQMNQLGLMQERNGGSVKKVKIKRLPRKRQ